MDLENIENSLDNYEPLTKRVLYIVVSCCMEESRLEILEKVIDSLKLEQERIKRSIECDMIAFDNGSKLEDSITQLKRLNCPLYVAKQNNGYWSALYWMLNHAVDYDRYDYVYIIESDHVHFALDKIELCERALNEIPSFGSVRTQEYSIENRHLYDKTTQHKDGKKYAWVSHFNPIAKQSVSLSQTHIPDIWESNFLTCLHSMNRLHEIRHVFNALATLENFSERDFQSLYYHSYPEIGQLDGGVFNALLGFTPYNPKSLSGSWSDNVQQFGYRETRNDRIVLYDDGDVELLDVK